MLRQNSLDNGLFLDAAIRSAWIVVVWFEIIYMKTKYILIFDGIGYGICVQLLFKNIICRFI